MQCQHSAPLEGRELLSIEVSWLLLHTAGFGHQAAYYYAKGG